jgi:hypothetical protein
MTLILKFGASSSSKLEPPPTPPVKDTSQLMRMILGLPEALPRITKRKFEAAKASSDLLFSPTEVAIIRSSAGVPVSVPTMPPTPDSQTSSSNYDTARRLRRNPYRSFKMLPQSRRSTRSRTPRQPYTLPTYRPRTQPTSSSSTSFL